MAIHHLVAIEESALVTPLFLDEPPPHAYQFIRTYVRMSRAQWVEQRGLDFPAMTPYIAVIGGSTATPEEEARAEAIGTALGQAGATVVSGGLGGVMAAACRGAKAAGALTIGILPGDDRAAANPWIDVAIPTGLGEARNALVVRTADAIVAVGGEYGTLSEIALALRAGKPVIGVGTWGLIRPSGVASSDVITAPDSAAAADLAIALAVAGSGGAT